MIRRAALALLLVGCQTTAPTDAGPEASLEDRALRVERTSDGRLAGLVLEERYTGPQWDHARRLLEENAEELGLGDGRIGFALAADNRVLGGSEASTFRITLDGVDVYAADVRFFARAGAIRIMLVNAPPRLEGLASTEPTIDAEASRLAVPATLAGELEAGEVSAPDAPSLTVFDRALLDDTSSDLVLAWQHSVDTSLMGPISVLLSATDGSLLAVFPLAHTERDREVRDGTGQSNVKLVFAENGGDVLYDEGGARGGVDETRPGYADATALFAHLGATHDWMLERWGVDSFDANGIAMRGASNFTFLDQDDEVVTNAAYYSVNDTFAFSLGMVTNDIVAHEVGHAALNRLGGGAPIYMGTPGAINESLADVLGQMLDPSDYTIGEGSTLGTLRSMDEPRLRDHPECTDSMRPAVMCRFFGFDCDLTQDHGFVHSNSAVGNRAYYLLREGSEDEAPSTPPCDRYDDIYVQPVPGELIELLYGVTYVMIGKTPNYERLRLVMELACEALSDNGEATANQCRHVANAFARVGIGEPVELEMSVSISADPTTAEVGSAALFVAEVTGGAPPYLYRWDFGDGDTSALPNDTHAFDAAGSYTVRLTVEDAGELSADAMLTFVVTEDGVEPMCRNYNAVDGIPEPVETDLPDCPDSMPSPPSSDASALERRSQFNIEWGRLGHSRYCGFNVTSDATTGSFGFVGHINVHPAGSPMADRPCAPYDCSMGFGYEVTSRNADGNPNRWQYYDATTHMSWEGGSDAVARDPSLQPELDQLVRALFDAYRSSALPCESP